MTETSHARSRRACLFGLILQLVAFAIAMGLQVATRSTAMNQLAWYLLGGVPIWFIALLIYRQRELAELEAMDLEELRREKQATGGGKAIFGQEGGAGLGYMVAENRLKWMQRWLVPGFGLFTAVYLVVMGLVCWSRLSAWVSNVGWQELRHLPVSTITLAIVMLFLFLFSRYASGMGRVAGWQLLRACGSYMLGTAVAAMALILSLGLQLYAQVTAWEHVLAYAIPVLMIVLGLETALNFVLDIYRPRTPGTEPRACFDSRLLGLIAEPGGIAHTVAEALNYQFGFQVSQTWFYKLLQRTFLPLIAVGAVILWALSSIVVVQPYERAIIEQFGRLMQADAPLEPGLHWKWPWPIAKAHRFNTGQLHEIIVGRKNETQRRKPPPRGADVVELWTDPRHGGYEHFDFLVAPTPAGQGTGGAQPAQPPLPRGDDDASDAAPVHIMRMNVAIQYKILPARLAAFTNNYGDPHKALLDVAWEEVVRFNAMTYVDNLLGEQREQVGRLIRERITKKIEDMDLGLEVVYVGLRSVHPERTVAEAFRAVVTAEQEKIAEIRKARVTENEILSRVAGDTKKALTFSWAFEWRSHYEALLNQSENLLRGTDPATYERAATRLRELEALFLAKIEAEANRDKARDLAERTAEEFELGMGSSARKVEQEQQALAEAEAAAQAATEQLAQALQPFRADLVRSLGQAVAEALIQRSEAQIGLEHWTQAVDSAAAGLEGETAVVLAAAQAMRWQTEMKAAGEVARLNNEREAYNVSPRIYKARRYLRVLVDGIANSRKYFMAFDSGDRQVRVTLDAQEQARPEDFSRPAQMEE